MSKLQELIETLCPNGVDCYPIKEIADVGTGSSNGNEAVDDGQYPFFIRSQSVKRKNNYEYNEEAIIIPGEGGIGEIYHYINGKYALHQRVYRIHFTKDVVDTKYAYHYFSANFKNFIMKKAVSATVKSIRKPMIQEFMLPVPPLEVQREIVRILDSFTLLTAELTAELTARKKQYEYYRDMLLTFDVRGGATSDVVWRTLGEVCNLQSGKAISAYLISDTQTVENSIPCYGANGLRGYVSTSNESGDKPIVGRQGALCGNVCFATGSYYATEHAVVVTDKGFFNSRFLYHLLVNADLNQYKTAGDQPGLSVARLNEVKVPVPTRTVQDRIANVLDNFDAICSDLNIGLPAEIEARQKQYEFYRDALLTFAETGNIIAQTDRQNIIKLIQYVFGFVNITLDFIAENCDSLRKPVTSGNREAGEYPYYGASGIVDYVSDYIFDGDYLLVSEDGANLLARSTPIAFSISGKNWVNNHAHVLRFETYATRRYVEFYLNSIDLSPWISGGAQPKLNQKNLNKINIPMPSLADQERIVGILDRFDALCNDLSSGLPAEIEARQKQYEFYRDKLLTFKQL